MTASMSIEHLEGPTQAPTYRGFSGPPPEDAPLKPARDPRPFMIAGVVVAAVLGVGLGFWANPPEIGAPQPRPMAAATPAAGDGDVKITVNPQMPLPVPKAGAPMEVLPPDMAQAAPRVMAMTAPRPIVPPRAAPAPLAPAEPARIASPAPAETHFANAPLDAVRPSFDCAGELSAAQAMVCDDARLAAKDRRLARAYRQALRAGAPADSLEAEQDDWRAIREDAASVSRRAVAQVYDQRIRELEAMADWDPDDSRQ